MAATQKLYPRGTVKRIVKAHSNRSVGKNADILVRPTTQRLATRQISLLTGDFPMVLQIFLDYMLFMQELMREASIRSRKSGEKNISANSIRKVTEKTLRKFQG
ncbi:transcriptional regulator family: Histone-like TF [Penicillium cataractarum]|uniref:Transcriptional regulator family: Histone-like TF n=1 Tax=Penicillium cataractarum TaxID=2100454 RepID=A0A9W9RSR4_9EURO|nr:transcriptional regulator family: Histone-like TF [Penicillium cataractarum]KAJ5364589.1 transcriptional regulator family: Histone-like TF [Penicillium cataractarum]